MRPRVSKCFWKMEGTGNHFFVCERGSEPWEFYTPELVRSICAHHFGVGADGVIVFDLARRNSEAPVPVLMRNPDGSPMGMCGNGIRCIDSLLRGHFKLPWVPVSYDVEGRLVTCWSRVDTPGWVTVDMGTSLFEPSRIPVVIPDDQRIVGRSSEILNMPPRLSLEAEGWSGDFFCVSMGNPHAVTFLNEHLSDSLFSKVGKALEHHPCFPERANIEFVKVVNPSTVVARIWERGAGKTMACGTGASALVVVGTLQGVLHGEVTVVLPGGIVKVRYDQETNRVYLSGPARVVFTGAIAVSDEGIL